MTMSFTDSGPLLCSMNHMLRQRLFIKVSEVYDDCNQLKFHRICMQIHVINKSWVGSSDVVYIKCQGTCIRPFSM